MLHLNLRRLPSLAGLLLAGAALLAPAARAEVPAWGLGPFAKADAVNPIVTPDKAAVFDCPMRKAPVRWEALHTFNPAAALKDGTVYVLYRAEDDTGEMKIGGHTSRLGMAESRDGLHFTRRPTPVFFPAEDAQKANEWDGGCEDPRIVQRPDGTFVMMYTQYNRKRTHLAVASSRDLVTWQKHGPVFAKAFGGKFAAGNKSASVVTELKDGRLVAAKINGKYWMYWGEGAIRLATSDDLIDWTPLVDGQGKLVDMLRTRRGKFDSALVEAGPPAVLTSRGIVLLYNGKNDGKRGDKQLTAGAYAGGQALFDAHDPAKLLARCNDYFFKPERPYEVTGQYKAGTVFIEGLVHFQNSWFLYYGTADSRVAVATAPAGEPKH